MFIKNGRSIPAEQAAIRVDNIEFSYGFGVYETLRVHKKIVLFPKEHVSRLLESARILGLQHSFTQQKILEWTQKIAETEKKETYNIKILLVGAKKPEHANLFLFPLNPLFPKPKIYRAGVAVISVHTERFLPKAKSLNMLESYLAYKKAREKGCFDALFVHHDDCVYEGTRSNLLCLAGNTIYSPPAEKILDGVTRKHVLQVAKKQGFTITEKTLTVNDLTAMDAVFLTGTSIKILPIRAVDGMLIKNPVPEKLKQLMRAYDEFQKKWLHEQGTKKGKKIINYFSCFLPE